MKKYVIESWLRLEDIFDTETEAQKKADLYNENPKHYKDTRFITLKDGEN